MRIGPNNNSDVWDVGVMECDGERGVCGYTLMERTLLIFA